MAEKSALKKAIPQDAEAYIAMAKEKASPSGKIMERVKAANIARIEAAATELELANVENALRSVKGVKPAQAESIASQIFKDKSPEEIREILAHLTPEMVNNLKLLAEATDTNPINTMMRVPPQQGGRSDVDSLVAVLRLFKEMQPAQQPANQAREIVEALVAGMKLAQGQQPQQGGLLETIKVMGEMNRPFYESLRGKDKELMDLKLKEIKDSMPPDPIEQIKYVKEVANTLGLSSAQKTEVDLKLEEMRQNQNIDMKRLDWEQKKFELEADNDAQKWDNILKIFQGPVGDVIKNMGSAGADRVRGGRGASAPVSSASDAIQTQCPNCGKAIYVDANAETAICGVCGAKLARQGGVTPQPEPESTHVDAAPASAEAPEQSEGNEETTDESAEAKETDPYEEPE